MKKIIFCILLFIAINTNLKAQDYPVYMSAGFKLSYAWGEINSGFLWGFEVSTIQINQSIIYGPVVAIDFFQGDPIVHIGGEASIGLVGIDIGPSFYFKNGKIYTGIGGSVYTGLLIMPFYSYTYYGKSTLSMNNVGTYLKIPFHVSGSTRSIFSVH